MGFNAGDGQRFFNVPNSRIPAIINITSTSNYDVPGKWIFQVDGEIIQNEEYSFVGGKRLNLFLKIIYVSTELIFLICVIKHESKYAELFCPLLFVL